MLSRGAQRALSAAIFDAPVLIADSCLCSNVQQPLEQVEVWVAAVGGGFERGAAEEAAGGAVTLSVTDALLPELCELRWCIWGTCAARLACLGLCAANYLFGLRACLRNVSRLTRCVLGGAALAAQAS